MKLVEIVDNLTAEQCQIILRHIAISYETYPNYLSTSTPYAAGYRAGIYHEFDYINKIIKGE